MTKGKQAICVVLETIYQMGKEENKPDWTECQNILMNVSDSLFDEQVDRFIKRFPEMRNVME